MCLYEQPIFNLPKFDQPSVTPFSPLELAQFLLIFVRWYGSPMMVDGIVNGCALIVNYGNSNWCSPPTS